MFALKHKQSSKYVSLDKSGSKMSTEKTIRTATVFPVEKLDSVKVWLSSCNALDKFTIEFLAGLDEVTENALVSVGYCKYNQVKKISEKAWEAVMVSC